MQNIVLKAQNITKTYQMGEVTVHALRDLSLEFYEGEFVVLLGQSGSGKSTLLNILGGLDRPTSGEVFFKDDKARKRGSFRLSVKCRTPLSST